MKVCILMGSPRPTGNTAELLKPFVEELESNRVQVQVVPLSQKKILSCKGCFVCQDATPGIYGCVHQDDMESIVSLILSSDLIVLATPVYTWFCPVEMKVVLDRFFGLNKYYGAVKSSMWEGKKLALLTTHGYEKEFGTLPLETGIISLCKHSHLDYLGMYSVRDREGLLSFQTEEAIEGARRFAQKLVWICK